jgi:hypothetical protein
MKNWHIPLLSIWLIATGVIYLFHIDCAICSIILAILGIVAGVLLLLAGKKVKQFHHLGALLLAILLIVDGAIFLFKINFSGRNIVLGILALLAAIMLVVGIKNSKIVARLDTLCLVVALILYGLILLISLSFSGILPIISILVIAAGALLLLQLNK